MVSKFDGKRSTPKAFRGYKPMGMFTWTLEGRLKLS
jgi:hypothetical protein